MKTTTKHTPTPWKMVQGIRNVCITDGRYTTAKAFSGSDKGAVDVEKSTANAEFIVRAVNSHEDLLDAMKEAQRLIDVADHEGAKFVLGVALAHAEVRS